MNFSHDDLIKIAERWLLKTHRCGFALTELRCAGASGEIPDAIGFKNQASILVECKADRADFLSDNKKIFRQKPELGMGAYRLYLCPAKVIQPEDLPEKWGLIWVSEKGKARLVTGPKGNAWSWSGKDFLFHERNLEAEWHMMVSALRRLHLRGVLPQIYDQSYLSPSSSE